MPDSKQKTLDEVVSFHGHMCPGLAIGYRVSVLALREAGRRSGDEEIVAIVENNSCAVDAVQVMTGCTFGKGNLIFRDYGKQVYTFIKRPTGEYLRISVKWASPKETDEERSMWERYSQGDRAEDVLKAVHNRKSKKTRAILDASDTELFDITRGKVEEMPQEARIYPSITCGMCGEKTMEPRLRVKQGMTVCIPCFEK